MNGVKKKLGFGFMRLPMKNGEINIEETNKMVDAFLANGFNYFDTAHGYLEEKSENAIRTCLTDRYDRDQYILTDKLTNSYFKKEEDIRPFVEKQLKNCGVEYFDYYLMHAQSATLFEYFKKFNSNETAFALKEK